MPRNPNPKALLLAAAVAFTTARALAASIVVSTPRTGTACSIPTRRTA
ncbi:MAG TPA: hypothetical protein PKM73_06860 [Verrucomicrobiota bacterium]|nr:hypothetical protein [Verrucomicrobiota bacterium]HNU49985.1 hypothetical protein [Verrucomicrobiota bacterium]